VRVEIINRQASVVVFDNDGRNYAASCQVFIYGDRGFMYTINGKEFYAAAIDGGFDKVMDELHIKSLEGYVVPAHARLMQIAMRGKANVEITGSGEMHGSKMSWVRITKKEDSNASV
jgi:hypothetical protein